MQTTHSSGSHHSFQGKPNYWLMWEICCNFLLAFFFLQFVVLNGVDLVNTFRLSTLLILMKVTADTSFHLVRSPAKTISKNVWDWFIGITGAFVLLFYRSVDGVDIWAGTGIQIIGLGLQVAAMCSLNRSIGFVAANRGIKTKGMYGLVRHPLYFAYTVAFFGFLLNHLTFQNTIVYLVMVLCLYLRTRCEEGVLTEDEEYREYKKKVRWRMIPGLL